MAVINVYLDDLRPCPIGFVLAKNAEECLFLLKECEVDALSLDYDLGCLQATGEDVVKAMISQRTYPQRIFLHSSNCTARKRMYDRLMLDKPDHVQVFNRPYDSR